MSDAATAFFQRLVIVLMLGFIAGTLVGISHTLKDIRTAVKIVHSE
jgi:hypothetical protein